MVNEPKLQSPYGQLDDCLKITNEQSTEVVYNFGDILELDREYTFSCWFRADSEIQISIQISNERSRYFPVTSEWQKVSFTASANTATSKKVFFTIPANNTLYAYEGMLELGNIASDFKPSEKDIENVVTTLQTNFTVQQGKIESLIKETTIDNGDGTTTSLKDAYNQTKQTVEGNTTTIANVQTKVNDLTGDVESMDYRITTVETTADGLKTTVSKASSDASSALTSANQTASKFSWIVKSGSSATDFTLTDRTASLVADYINLNGKVTFSGLDSSAQNKINTAQSTANTANSKIDNLEIGGRNLLINSYKYTKDNPFTLTTTEEDGYTYINTLGMNVPLVAGQSYVIQAKTDGEWSSVHGGQDPKYVNLWLVGHNSSFGSDNILHCVLYKPNLGNNSWLWTCPDYWGGKYLTIRVNNYNTNGTTSVTHKYWDFKVELGNKATDWTPAPEDKADQSIIDNWAKDSVVNGETVINGGYIKTNTIKTDQLAVDDIFATGSSVMNIINAQEINANRITSGQLSAERINVYGLSVLNKDNNQQTFNIANNGEVTIKGSVSSSNYNIGKTGWAINNDGTAEFNDIIARGSVITNDGGIANSGSVRFWAGTSYEERESAPWIVYSDGSMKATQGEFSGVFSGIVDIGNIRIVDPSSASGGDALLTIQDGGSGLKRIQLTDGSSSIFAQDLIISNNTYSPMVTLKQDGTALFDRGINIGDSKDNSNNVILNKTSLIISNKELTTTSTGFLINSNLDVGSSNNIAHLTVHGDTISDSMTLANELNFGGVVKFTTTSNGINIDFVE